MQWARTLYSTYYQSQHITEEHNQGVATWFTRTGVSLMLNSHPKHEEALPTSQSSEPVEDQTSTVEGDGRRGVRARAGCQWQTPEGLGSALPVWGEGGQRGAPLAAAGASQRERAAGADNSTCSGLVGPMESEPGHFQKAGNREHRRWTRKRLQCRLQIMREWGISCLLCLLWGWDERTLTNGV